MQEKGVIYPSEKKELECLDYSPSVQDDYKIELDCSPPSRETPNPSADTTVNPEKKRLTGLIFHAVLRLLQCIFAVVVAILYGLDLAEATRQNATADPSWVYAELVAGLSMIICIMQLFFVTAVWYWCLLDALMSVLWLAQFGVFASMYRGAGFKETSAPISLDRMQAAVWINLVCVGLWFAATIYGSIGCCARFKRSRQKNKYVGVGLMADSEQAAGPSAGT
ncbi:marvellike domain [Fusarium sporotrichioides]|uniref:Marvellike domain n=1 Tax=Fusarium sporotrichioides TaxID=5514 RepID=A0A395RWT5_FUSSP|nr:marvellike domain [Fusarium sporotrichioides]